MVVICTETRNRHRWTRSCRHNRRVRNHALSSEWCPQSGECQSFRCQLCAKLDHEMGHDLPSGPELAIEDGVRSIQSSAEVPGSAPGTVWLRADVMKSSRHEHQSHSSLHSHRNKQPAFYSPLCADMPSDCIAVINQDWRTLETAVVDLARRKM